MRPTWKNFLYLMKNQSPDGPSPSLGPSCFSDPGTFFKHWEHKDPADITFGDWGNISTPNPVLSIGDIHGDMLALLGALFLGNVIDINGNWSQTNTIVVLVGDILDRSGRRKTVNTSFNHQEEVQILQYLFYLDAQAKASGGQVIPMVGNHDVWNFIGTSEFSKFNYGGWGGKKNKYSRFFRQGTPMATFYAQRCPAILKINDCLFMHGGLHTDFLALFMEEQKIEDVSELVQNINMQFNQWVTSNKATHLPLILKHILTDRRLAQTNPNAQDPVLSEVECTAEVAKIRQMLGMKNLFLIVGHTQQAHTRMIPVRCSGTLWAIDVSLSEAFGRKGKQPMQVLLIKFPQHQNPILCTITGHIQEKKYTCMVRQVRCYQNGQKISKKHEEVEMSESCVSRQRAAIRRQRRNDRHESVKRR